MSFYRNTNTHDITTYGKYNAAFRHPLSDAVEQILPSEISIEAREWIANNGIKVLQLVFPQPGRYIYPAGFVLQASAPPPLPSPDPVKVVLHYADGRTIEYVPVIPAK